MNKVLSGQHVAHVRACRLGLPLPLSLLLPLAFEPDCAHRRTDGCRDRGLRPAVGDSAFLACVSFSAVQTSPAHPIAPSPGESLLYKQELVAFRGRNQCKKEGPGHPTAEAD